jgi:DNA repair exonuclease SbcCD ATPase subunit
MNTTSKLKRIYLKQFIGIYNGLSLKELDLDLSNLLDKEIILILGDNGHGKSTLSSVMHPLTGSTDGRKKLVRKDKEGIKIAEYIRSDGVDFECKVVYSPTKTGHSCKGFVRRIDVDGVITEMNPNGNISSYEEVVAIELGITPAILKLSAQNDVTKGMVDMTSTERKTNMAAFLPDDTFSAKYTIVDKRFKDMKTRVSIIVDNMGKLEKSDILVAYLKTLTTDINELVEKRDKTIGKVREYETHIDILTKDTDLEKAFKGITKRVNELVNNLEKTSEKIKILLMEANLEDTTLNKITKFKDTLTSDIIESDKILTVLLNNIERVQRRRNDICDELTTKESILADIMSDATVEELDVILVRYTKRVNYLANALSKLDTNLRKDDLIAGYDIVANIRDGIINITSNSSEAVDEALHDYGTNKSQEKLDELYEKRTRSESISSEITTKINSLNSNSYMKDVLDKRPQDCKIDDCPFIANAKKWDVISAELDKYNKLVDKSDETVKSIYDKIQYQEEVVSTSKQISNLMSFIKVNYHIITKLPYSDKYKSEESLLKCIKKRDILTGVDDFDPFIEILEYREEHDELQYKKIPSLTTEIHIMKTQGKLIESTRQDVIRLRKEEKSMQTQLIADNKQYEDLENSMNNKRDILETLNKLYERKVEYNNIYDEVMESKTLSKELETKLSDLEEYRDKLKKKKSKMKEIEEDLAPLSRKRDIYRLQQVKLEEYTIELAALQTDMTICEIIRDSLSTRKGMPIDVMEMYMDNIRDTANVLLSGTFGGSLYLELFDINEKDFTIPFKRGGDIGEDVSLASSSERSFISLCLSLAIIEEVLSTYGILILDEVDRGFSETNKYIFVKILGEQIKRVGISQTFMTTHNREYYEDYNVGFILFPGHGLNTSKYDDADMVRVY